MTLSAIEIKENRKKLGLSQRKLALIIGVSEIAVSRWENGYMCPTDANNLKLLSFFKVGKPAEQKFEEIITGEIKNIKNSINKIQIAFKKLKVK